MTTDLRTNLGYKEKLLCSLEKFFIMETIRQTSFNAKQLINVEIELNGVRILVRASVNNTAIIEHPSNAC